MDKELLEQVIRRYPVQVNAYCRDLAERSDAVRKLYYPDVHELENPEGVSSDGLAELAQTPVPGLIRRFGDRAVVLTTSACFARCRFCFRKRLWSCGAAQKLLSDEELSGIVEYLNTHREIHDILLSGGDPLTLPDERLLHLAETIRSAGEIRTIRICSRAPAVEPGRITEDLARKLGKIEGAWFVTHFDHPDELTQEAKNACRMLVRNGIPVLNQTVLLRGINDSAEILEELFRGLIAIRVKPHYLFHADPIEGAAHFATGVEKGLEILQRFRYELSSIATPYFAIDLPGGAGKVNLTPDCRRADGAYLSCVTGQYVFHPLTDLHGENKDHAEN